MARRYAVSTVTDNYAFYDRTLVLQDTVTQQALLNAKEKYEEKALSEAKLYALARNISRTAFDDYRNLVAADFNSKEYTNLINLLMDARAKYFFDSLPTTIRTSVFKLQD